MSKSFDALVGALKKRPALTYQQARQLPGCRQLAPVAYGRAKLLLGMVKAKPKPKKPKVVAPKVVNPETINHVVRTDAPNPIDVDLLMDTLKRAQANRELLRQSSQRLIALAHEIEKSLNGD